jgi:hypothetical protein
MAITLEYLKELSEAYGKEVSIGPSSIGTSVTPEIWKNDGFLSTNKMPELYIKHKKNLIAPYQLQSKMRIDLNISPLGNEGFKNSIKTKLLQMMIGTIKHKTTFTQMNDDSNVVEIKAKVYVFSEQELLQFIDRCRE